MTTRPDLDYVDEGVDLQDPALYRPSRGRFGRARMLTPIAFRSKVFADLEDEKIWTRSWVCIGAQREIPGVGDLLPYTVGNHGVHVQREREGLVGRFNLAQHGGCRFVPAQCQTGSKTRCSFTSCGYSRDRGVIGADELGDDTPAMRQYLGFRPERLLPVKVESLGPLLFVNLDPAAAPLAQRLDAAAPALSLDAAAAWDEAESFRAEYAGNWKLLGRALVRCLAPGARPAKEGGEGDTLLLRATCEFAGAPATLCWLLPNLLLLRTGELALSIVLQPTALEETLARVRIASARPVEPATLAGLRAALDEAGAEAAALQEELGRFGTPSRPETSLEDLPVERDRTAHLLQSYVIARVLARHEVHWSGPLYAAAMP